MAGYLFRPVAAGAVAAVSGTFEREGATFERGREVAPWRS